MDHTKAELREELAREVFLLKALRDEALAHLHLDGPRGQHEWERLEPLVRAAIALGEREASEESCWSVAKAAMAMRALCAFLRDTAHEDADHRPPTRW